MSKTLTIGTQVTCTEMPGVIATVVGVVGAGAWARVTIQEPGGTARMLVPAFTVEDRESR